MALLSSFSRCLLSSFLNSKTFFLDRLISQAADTSLNLRRTPTSEMTQVKKKRLFLTGYFGIFSCLDESTGLVSEATAFVI
jgi:hypothetical protein